MGIDGWLDGWTSNLDGSIDYTLHYSSDTLSYFSLATADACTSPTPQTVPFPAALRLAMFSALLTFRNTTLTGSILAGLLRARFAPAPRRGVDPNRWGGFLTRFALALGVFAASCESGLW